MLKKSTWPARRPLRRVRLLALLMTVGVLAGCTADGGSVRSGPSAPSSSDTLRAGGQVDPQILSDVIDGVFPLPGPSVLRTMRVNRAEQSIRNVACGGTPYDVNDTSSRFDQAHFAYLDLIKKKGLVEQVPTSDKNAPDQSDACREGVLLTWQESVSLVAQWEEAVRAALQSPSVTATKPATAQCLRRGSGLTVSDSAPTASFLARADGELLADPTNAANARLATLYAECTPEFFSALGAALQAERAPLVERNREMLTKMAVELSSAGYVP